MEDWPDWEGHVYLARFSEKNPLCASVALGTILSYARPSNRRPLSPISPLFHQG